MDDAVKKLMLLPLAIEEDEEYTTEFNGATFKYRRIPHLKMVEIQEQYIERGRVKQSKVDRAVLDYCLLGWENYRGRDIATGKIIDIPFEKKYIYGLPLEYTTHLTIKFLSAHVEVEIELKNCESTSPTSE